MGLLQHLLHVTNFRNPLLRNIVPAVSAAFAIQTAFAIPSVLAQSERFYDASGALTFLSVTLLSLYLPSLRTQAAAALKGTDIKLPSLLSPLLGGGASAFNWRQVALSASALVWSIRPLSMGSGEEAVLTNMIYEPKVGSYLFARILKEGKDSRFDKLRNSPPKFLAAWVGQAMWVSLCLMPVAAVNAVPSTVLAALPAWKISDVIGLAIFAGGFLFEIIADRQKSQWVHEKSAKQHDEDFITRGLWSKSQYPNYFGECTLWTGIATAAAGVLTTQSAQAALGFSGGVGGRLAVLGLSYISPAFATLLLTKISGIPLSERKYDRKFGHRKDYQEWKKNTPKFFPKL
ncbi:hypothetical protein BX600DRAFT_539555 [Xylariales sp. PMI_506]|nr:hypothetical protein BX600DRAFT_539555 [Xylariales sp. PMI_506]